MKKGKALAFIIIGIVAIYYLLYGLLQLAIQNDSEELETFMFALATVVLLSVKYWYIVLGVVIFTISLVVLFRTMNKGKNEQIN